jgi:5-methyltetrahydrofolate--homocysteine methyltransferase
MVELKDLVINGDDKGAAKRVAALLAEGKAPADILNNALIAAMDEVGDKYQKGDFFLPELLIAGRAMHAGLAVLRPSMVEKGVGYVGKVVMGTVRGDLHDLGKNLVNMSLEGAGFEVIDVGIDVSPEKFVEAVRKHSPQVLGMSALLTTTAPAIKETIDALTKAGLRSKVKIMIGGAPITQDFAREVGADFYAPDSTAGKDFARSIVNAGA